MTKLLNNRDFLIVERVDLIERLKINFDFDFDFDKEITHYKKIFIMIIMKKQNKYDFKID